ncbi:MAG TPA: heavy metal-binding domain-containing protein [Acidimicrobiia bacterium]|nr:heavy metal-binding domain-containing protein [Acidimicrobiia bacterium]
MADDSTLPEFNLPDWGTEGAPPAPIVDDDPAGEIEISVEQPVVVTAGSLPSGWTVRTIHGLVAAHAKSEKDDTAKALDAATARCLDELQERAASLGANAVIDAAISVTERKSRVIVTAWGTAVSFSR